MSAPTTELYEVFDARRVKAPDLKGVDSFVNGIVGWFRNRRPILRDLTQQAERIDALEPEIQKLSSSSFSEAVDELRGEARRGPLEGESLERAMALAREAAWRTLGQRPFLVQLIGGLAMYHGYVAEMATGEGKTLTATMPASLWGWAGRPVHIITVNDYLVQRDAAEMGPVYKMLGLKVGHVVHEMSPRDRIDHYRRNVIYTTSKELVADFLRDQIGMGPIRNSMQASVKMLATPSRRTQTIVPGLFRAIVDEADSLLIDEAVTPLIISNAPTDDANADLYRAAYALTDELVMGRDYKIDWTVRQIDLTTRGRQRLAEVSDESGFWKGARRREELVTQALTAKHCFVRGEQYIVTDDGKVQIVDEFTGRVMADRSWRHGLHQAIEVKEGVTVTSDKENLARLSFQRFFRQYPKMAGMTGTAWESSPELWQIYHLPVVRIPTNEPCIRVHLPTRMFDTLDKKWEAVVDRVCELNDLGAPVLIGTRSVQTSEELSKRLKERGRQHNVLNAIHHKEEARVVAEAGQPGKITVATNMAGRGTDIKLGKGVADLGGLHVIATEPHGSGRVDRQLFGRSARQGDPGAAQMFASKDDDVFKRHLKQLRHQWRRMGVNRVIKLAQNKAEQLARFNRKQVLRSDDWMDQTVPF